MICNKCNRKNDNKSTKCKYCGAKLNSVLLKKDKKPKTDKHKKTTLVLSIIALCLSAISCYLSLFMAIPIISLTCAIIGSVFSIKNRCLLPLSTVAISIASSAFTLNLMFFIMNFAIN